MTAISSAFALTTALIVGSPAAPATAAKPQAQVSAPRASDRDLKDRIEHRLDTDASVRKYDVSVSVRDGVATLNGKVATAAQKDSAGRVAHVSGVTRVDNQIAVDRDVDKTLMEKTKSGLSKTGEAINDSWITSKVKWHLTGDDALKGSDVSVTTRDHVVTLSGTCRTAAGRARAVELARMTDGVQRVVDSITIGPKAK